MCGSLAFFLSDPDKITTFSFLSITISVLQLSQLGILIRYGTHTFCVRLELLICESVQILCVCICCRAPGRALGKHQTKDGGVHQH